MRLHCRQYDSFLRIRLVILRRDFTAVLWCGNVFFYCIEIYVNFVREMRCVRNCGRDVGAGTACFLLPHNRRKK